VTFEEHLERDLSASVDWLRNQRWFGDKSRTLSTMTLDNVAIGDTPTGSLALAIVRCVFDEGEDTRYFVPVIGVDAEMQASERTTTSTRSTMRDALRDADVLAWFFESFRRGNVIDHSGTWRWQLLPGADVDLAPIDASDTRVMNVEQSNTSILFDHRVMAKVFRRLQPGINPDLEVTQYLTTVARYPHVPKLYGLFTLDVSDQHLTLGVLQQFVPNVGDGWSWLLGELRALTPDRAQDLVQQVGLLGMRTGELHVALGAPSEDVAFAPEILDDRSVEALKMRVQSELDETLASLRTLGNKPAAVLAKLEHDLGARISEASALAGTLSIRVHGDYHLGQVLRTLERDFAIIDFEGEPSRSIAERRQKFSPLKDVAGMLRSLDYATGTVGREIEHSGHRELLARWGDQARRAFLAEYSRAVEAGDKRLTPATSDAFDSGLHVLEIEKSLYEARYEMNNRPDWLDIPWSALLGLASDNKSTSSPT